jgi:hypothetical protein
MPQCRGRTSRISEGQETYEVELMAGSGNGMVLLHRRSKAWWPTIRTWDQSAENRGVLWVMGYLHSDVPGGTCTHWKSAALPRRTPQAVIHAPQQRYIAISALLCSFRPLQEPEHHSCVFCRADLDADGHRPVDGHAAHDAWLVAVIVDCFVLGRAIVPDHHIARRLAPAPHVFQPRHVILQHGKQMA